MLEAFAGSLDRSRVWFAFQRAIHSEGRALLAEWEAKHLRVWGAVVWAAIERGTAWRQGGSSWRPLGSTAQEAQRLRS